MIVISNGFSKFHLAVAAEELYQRSLLSLMLTGAYPTRQIQRMLKVWPGKKNRKARRLLARCQQIDDRIVQPIWIPESIHALGHILDLRLSATNLAERLYVKSMMVYGARATSHVIRAAQNGARIYHYRAGYGHESVLAAKDLGMLTICDYTIAHGALLTIGASLTNA